MARRRRPRRRPPERSAQSKRVKPKADVSEEVESQVIEPEALELRPVAIPDTASIGEIAERSGVPPTDIIMELLNRGVLTTINAAIDRDTARAVMANLGVEVLELKDVTDEKSVGSVDPQQEESLDVSDADPDSTDEPAELKTGELRPPVVTVMGHVDHGKTTLLDAIRKTNVVDSEFGGITQHIGAYQVAVKGQPITFIDTPGHEAFTAMRARGAQVTDVAIIVVAADDGVMPQTVEAIGHAKAAGVPIIVAVNKIDLEGSNPDRVLQQLTEHEIVVEKFGGDVVAVPLSALQGEGIEDLLEYVQLTAELEDLRAPVDGPSEGIIIETRLDRSQGAVATVLPQRGTLKVGDSVSTGAISGRVRALFDDTGGRIKSAGPATPVAVVGLESMPNVGDSLKAVKADRKKRRRKELVTKGSGDQAMRLSLESLAAQMTAGRLQQINLVVKADTAGSVDAVVSSINQLGDDRARAMIVYEGVGPVNESDINLASAAKGLVLGFNVRADVSAEAEADRQNVQIRSYRTIYELIDDVDASLKGSIKPEEVDVVDGRLEIRGEFRSERNRQIVGGMVLSGRMYTGADVRILRADEEVGTGKITTLRRFADETEEVREGFDCGLAITTTVNIQLADIIEAHHTEERLP
ncbi:MAG: translation initiation factor IF-2 [Chloroflexi bacterium]|nr:translation initiation factor IF-2 [Chloroflexota bacterium]|tara:strand:- start:11888 stop:13807 length:1920 start_codon:yes stop_codon:yes gene_type:complete